MVQYSVLMREGGRVAFVVARDAEAATPELAEGFCIAVFAGDNAFERASEYALAKGYEAMHQIAPTVLSALREPYTLS